MNLNVFTRKGKVMNKQDMPNWNRFLKNYLAERKKVKPNKEGRKEVKENDR